jgi:aldehyde dehydrogenase (NAD+)
MDSTVAVYTDRAILARVVIPEEIPNIVDGQAAPAATGEWFDKVRPADGTILCRAARSRADDVAAAVTAAHAAQPTWAKRTAVERGEIVRELALRLRERREEGSEIVAEETGKPMELALAETDAAVEMGLFVAGEGRRYYGRTTTASMPHRTVLTVRQPLGVAGLIMSFNTPLPNVAWKAFPAVFCGNAAVVKPSEHTPASAWFFAELAHESGLPPGVLNVVQGLGQEAGVALVEHPEVDLVSFTGSAETGAWINETAGSRLAKVCLELGGKNALVVCDDADLEAAVRWALASAFSNAGQRCASASRIVVFEGVYDAFRARLVSAAQALPPDPVISESSLDRILAAVVRAVDRGSGVLTGGERLDRPGWYLAPTVLEGAAPDAEISRTELFGPVTLLYRVRDLEESIAVVNDSPYGLTAAIHTESVHRAMRFADEVQAGVVIVNGGTHGSEPHMGFGGVKQSGTGWREAGIEALDVYSDLKVVNLIADPIRA